MTDEGRPKEPPRRRRTPPGRTLLALVSAWLVPGLGHVILGRARRGLFFSVLVLGCFTLGLAHDGRLALRDRQAPFLSTLQVMANLGLGPADALARIGVYGEPAYALPSSRVAPAGGERLRILRARDSSAVAMYGTAYLWTAGLMNLLLLFDVWDIGRGRKA
jgi:hypothetical protein